MSPNLTIANRFAIADPACDLLGRGGMGAVYRAADTQTGETVAVKVLNPENLDPELLDRFRREGEALRQLNHPNIVRFVAAVEEGGQHFLAMEYVLGGSLEDLLAKQGRLPYAQAVETALDLADALTRAHRLGILHRDLKPANVLLDAGGAPKLADFGIAYRQSAPHLTQTGVLVGTVDYLSPEACQGQPPDERSDIWAFGVLLYQMLTGQLPFQGENLTARIMAILMQPTPDISESVPDVPDALADLVYRMLEKDPQRRIPSVRLVGAELEAIEKGHTPAQFEKRFAAPTPSPQAPRHNLPAQATPFVGRQAELAELDRLLSNPDVRLVTIVGLGGMGKTRLALEAGAAQLGRTRDGVFFTPLAPLRTAEAIVPALAQAMGLTFHETEPPRWQLINFLKHKQALLILDNCEHLLVGDGEAGALVSDILAAACQTRILATSRLRLGIDEESVYPLGGIDAPFQDIAGDVLQSSAGQLFLQGARRVRPGFEPGAADLQPIAEICRMVQGMPLAILLAAAWVEMLAPAEIAAEIQASFDFLQSDRQGIPVRQHSLRLVFDYSWNLLSDREQRILAVLSVFRGGFTREAAQAVAGAALRELMSLTNKSLLQRTPAGRYQIHELLRQYAAEKLHAAPPEERAAHNAHALYYAGFLQVRARHLHTSSQKQAMLEIGVEIDNLRLAWDRMVDNDDAAAIQAGLDGLAEFYRTRGLLGEGREAFARADRMLAASSGAACDAQTRLALARLQAQGGLFCDFLGDNTEANRLIQASLTTARELGAQRETAVALSYLGGSASLYGGSQCSPCEEALEIFRQLDDRWGIAVTLRGLGWVALHAGNYPLAKERFQESVDAFRELGDPQGLAESLGARGYIAWILGEYEQGQRFHQEMLALCRENGDRRGMARALGDLGIDACGRQQFEESLRLFGESLVIYTEIGDRWGMADEVGDMGELSNALGRYSDALEYANQSLGLQVKRMHGLSDWEQRILGNAHLGLGNYQAAAQNFAGALQSGQAAAKPGRILFTISNVAALFAARAKTEFALELLAMVHHDPRTWQLTKDFSAGLYARLKASLPAEISAAAEQRGHARDLEATVAELLEELSRL